MSTVSMATPAMSIGGNPLIGHIRDIPTVRICHVVVDVLDPAVWEGHPVGAGGDVPVPLLVLTEVDAAVVVGDSVLVGVDGGLVVVSAAGMSAAVTPSDAASANTTDAAEANSDAAEATSDAAEATSNATDASNAAANPTSYAASSK